MWPNYNSSRQGLLRKQRNEGDKKNETIQDSIGILVGYSFHMHTQQLGCGYGYLERCGNLPCESCNNIVSFNFYLIIVSSA